MSGEATDPLTDLRNAALKAVEFNDGAGLASALRQMDPEQLKALASDAGTLADWALAEWRRTPQSTTPVGQHRAEGCQDLWHVTRGRETCPVCGEPR